MFRPQNTDERKGWATGLLASLTVGLAFAFLTWVMIGDHRHPMAIPTDLDFLGSVFTLLLFPGLIAGFLISGNIHIANTWFVALGNFIFYFGIAQLALKIRERRKARRTLAPSASPNQSSATRGT
jgi:hypothetical protein